MAEINIPAINAGKAGVRRSKKLSTRVDLTSMVDLGFLLITFFIFSNTLSDPKALKLNMPADGGGTTIGQSTVLTVIPMAANAVFYYHGDLEGALKNGAYGTTSYSITKGLGEVIRNKQAALNESKRKDLMVLIKPADESTCGNVVDVMDELQINQVLRYAMVDLENPEKKAITEKTGLVF